MNSEFVKARARLILDQPFFGTLCLGLKPVEWEEPTGAVDGVHLFYNPKWFGKLSELERVGFLAHEVMHMVLMHHVRRQERLPNKWNVAGDYAINNHLIAENFILPKGGLVDDEYLNMMSELIYNLLPEPPGGWEDMKFDSGMCGGVLDHPGADGTPGTRSAIEAKLTVAINQAAEQAKAQGKLSANMQELVSDIASPKIDWKMVLARFLRANNKSDFSWLRPNKRFIGRGLYLPSLHTPCLEEVAVVCDTSGSRTDEELSQDLAEISSILRDLNPEAIHLIQCDMDVNSDISYTRESLPLKTVEFDGRGGTAFSPAIEYVNKHHPNVASLIYLTDLECDDFGDAPHYPVLWITTQPGEAPYGEIIEM